MKLKKILFGLACMSLMASCADLDYHEYLKCATIIQYTIKGSFMSR